MAGEQLPVDATEHPQQPVAATREHDGPHFGRRHQLEGLQVGPPGLQEHVDAALHADLVLQAGRQLGQGQHLMGVQLAEDGLAHLVVA